MTEENVKIQSELQSWHEWYNEDTGTRPQSGEELTSLVLQSVQPIPIFGYKAQPEPYFVNTFGAAMAISTPMSTPVLSSPILGIGNVERFDAVGNFTRYGFDDSNVNMSSGSTPMLTP